MTSEFPEMETNESNSQSHPSPLTFKNQRLVSAHKTCGAQATEQEGGVTHDGSGHERHGISGLDVVMNFFFTKARHTGT